jgi:hypothetical protein
LFSTLPLDDERLTEKKLNLFLAAVENDPVISDLSDGFPAFFGLLVEVEVVSLLPDIAGDIGEIGEGGTDSCGGGGALAETCSMTNHSIVLPSCCNCDESECFNLHITNVGQLADIGSNTASLQKSINASSS